MSAAVNVEIREARREDMVHVAALIKELAAFENMPNGPQLTVADLQRDGFDPTGPAFKCLVAVINNDGEEEIVGYALYFPTYSTWEGRAMMLEDLYVKQSHRRRGIGEKLFNAVAKETFMGQGARLDFHVLEWNEARGFYDGRGAVNMTQSENWCYYRLAGNALIRASFKHVLNNR